MRRVCFGVLGLILLGGAGLLWWWSTSINSERIEQTLAARVGEATGFKVSFGEAMEFEWLPVPGLVAQDITLSNPRESQDSPLARIRKIRVRLDVFGSLRHRMVKLGRLSATGVQIRLTRNAEGEANWQTGAETGTGDDVEDGDDLVSRVQALEIQDLDAHYRDAVTGEAFELSLVSFHLDRAPSGGPADLEAKGELNGESFALTGTLSPDLGKGQAGGTNTRELGNFRLDILINIGNGAATLNVSGLTGRPSDFLGTDLEISVVSPDPSALARPWGRPDLVKWAKALGSIQFRGNLVADGRSGLSLREGKLELGTAKSFRLSLSGSVQDVLGGSGFEMDLDLQSTSPSATLSSLDLDWPPLDGLQGQAQLRGSLAVPGWEEVKVSVGLASGLKLEAQGRVDGRGDTLTAEFDLSLRAGNVRHLVESISDLSHDLGERIQSWVEATQQRPVAQHLLTLAPVEASAQIEGSENRWRLVKASGQAGSPDGEWLRVSGQAKVFWPELAGLELGAELHLPNLPEAWGPLVASARAKGSAAGWVLDPLDLKLDRGHVTGRGAWTQKDQAPHFELSLHSAQLDLRGPFTQKQEPESESETASSPPETEEEGPFSFEWLSGTQARIELSADRVLLGEAWNANDLEMSVRWADGQLEGPDLKLDWPEGGVRTRGRLDAVGAVPSLDFGLSAEGIDVEAVEAWLGQPSILTGQAQWTLDLKTRGHSRKEFLSNMGGGTIVYVQHGTVLDRYADAIELGIRLGSRAGKRPMNCLIAALLVNQGLIRTEALFWETPHKKLIGVGALDLTQQHMDLLLRPHLTSAIPTGVTAAIRIEGPLDDLRTRPEPLQTVADLTRGLFGRVLRAVRVVSPQLSDAVAGVGSTTDRMLVSTGLDVPSLLRVLAKSETCESVLSKPQVKELRSFNPDSIEAH